MSLQVFVIENQQLEIQSQGLFELNIQVENSQEIRLADVICLDSSQSTIIKLENFPKGQYILYLYSSEIEAEGLFNIE